MFKTSHAARNSDSGKCDCGASRYHLPEKADAVEVLHQLFKHIVVVVVVAGELPRRTFWHPLPGRPGHAAGLDDAVLPVPPTFLVCWRENFGKASRRKVVAVHAVEETLDRAVLR